MVWESLGAFWQTPSRLSCAIYWGAASVWPLYHKGLIGGVLQRWLSFCKVLPSPQRTSGALSEWLSGPWSPPWPRPFSPIAQFGRAASSRWFQASSIKEWWSHSVLGDLQCCRNVLIPFPRSVPQHNPLSAFSYNSFNLTACFFTLSLSTVGLYIDRFVPFQIMSNQLNLPQVDSNWVIETSQGWSMVTGCTRAQFWDS